MLNYDGSFVSETIQSRKFENAIVFICNNTYKFALASMLVNLKETQDNFLYEVIVYYDGFEEDDCRRLRMIYENIRFIRYTFDMFEEEHGKFDTKNKKFIHKFSHLAYIKYKIFELLKDYSHVLYLDLDMLIMGDIRDIFEIRGIAWRNGESFLEKFEHRLQINDYPDIERLITTKTKAPNGGLLYISNVKSYLKCMDDAKEFVTRFKNIDSSAIDEMAVAYAVAKNEIPLTSLDPNMYNSLPKMYQYGRSIIVHFMGADAKPWNNDVIQTVFPDWLRYYYLALEISGINSQSVVDFGITGKNIKKLMNCKRWLNFLGKTKIDLPNELKLKYDFENEWLIMTLNEEVYYYFRFRDSSTYYSVGMRVSGKVLIEKKEIRANLELLCQINPDYYLSVDERGITITSKSYSETVIFGKFLKFYSNTISQVYFNSELEESILNGGLLDNKKMFDVALLGRYNNLNWGGQLTVLASFVTIKELGFTVKMLKLKNHDPDIKHLYNSFVEYTKVEVNNPSPCKNWNNNFDSFVLCSDWTFNKNWFLPLETRLFTWVNDDKKIVSYASSFGKENGGYTENDYPMLKEKISRFSAISVREKSGISLLKKIGIDNAVQVPDPVFGQKESFYSNLAQKEQRLNVDRPYVAVYLLDMREASVKKALSFCKSLGKEPVFCILFKDRGKTGLIGEYEHYVEGVDGVPLWLKCIEGADYVITNSFHAICMSLIFHKEFIAFERQGFSNTRVGDILETLNLKERFVKVDDNAIPAMSEIDYVKIQERIDDFYCRTRDFIFNALSDEKKVKTSKNVQRIDSLPQSACVGCMSCKNVCPVNCIDENENKQTGFYFPKIEEEKCVHCGLCAKVCPVINKREKNHSLEKVYCGYSLDEKTRYESTSGGFFTEIAMHTLEDPEAVVFGAAYETPYEVAHEEIKNIVEISKIRQSKYVQSRMRDTYKRIEERLKNDKTVLFCGTPCQGAALSAYLETKGVNRDRLVIVDFICHSVNSPKAYQAYLREIEDSFGKKISRVWFKNKEIEWKRFTTRIDFEGTDDYYIKDRYEDPFYKGFLKHHLYSRSSCTTCQFKGVDRYSDITLADAWGISTGKDDKHGISTAIIHTEKGQKVFDAIRDRLFSVEKSVDDISRGNPNFMSASSLGKYSEYFYSRLGEGVAFSKIIEEIEGGNFAPISEKETLKSGDESRSEENIIVLKNGEWLKSEMVILNGAIIQAAQTAQIVLTKGSRLVLNEGLLPGSKEECLIRLEEGAKLVIDGTFKIYHSSRIVVHKDAYLKFGSGYMNTNGKIICRKSIEINDAIIAPDCYIIDSDYHSLRDKDGNVINHSAPVKFLGHVWLGQNVTVLKGVTIGKGACVGAKSLVNKSIPAHCLAVGNPAQVIKEDISWG